MVQVTRPGPVTQVLHNVLAQTAASAAPWTRCQLQKLPLKSVLITFMVVPSPIRARSRPCRQAFQTGSLADLRCVDVTADLAACGGCASLDAK